MKSKSENGNGQNGKVEMGHGAEANNASPSLSKPEEELEVKTVTGAFDKYGMTVEWFMELLKKYLSGSFGKDYWARIFFYVLKLRLPEIEKNPNKKDPTEKGETKEDIIKKVTKQIEEIGKIAVGKDEHFGVGNSVDRERTTEDSD